MDPTEMSSLPDITTSASAAEITINGDMSCAISSRFASVRKLRVATLKKTNTLASTIGKP